MRRVRLVAMALCSIGWIAVQPACGTQREEPDASDAQEASDPRLDAAATPARDADDAGERLTDLLDASADAEAVGVREVDAGEASAADAGARGPCPDDAMARIGRFCIDRWEAHLVGADDDGGFVALPPNERPVSDGRFEARSEAGVMPQAYISRVEASHACKAAGKRLCSMREWRRACGGKLGGHYPYGTKYSPKKCNVAKPHLLAMRYGSDARLWKYEENFNDPTLDTEEGFLAKTGAYESCRSDSGVFDLAGNLHEWVSDAVDEAFVEKLEDDKVERHKQPWKKGNGVFVGGFFSTTDQHGPGCLFTTIAHEPSYHDYSIGFRCCADATSAESAPKQSRPKRDAGAR